jgi:hypothetical protein
MSEVYSWELALLFQICTMPDTGDMVRKRFN